VLELSDPNGEVVVVEEIEGSSGRTCSSKHHHGAFLTRIIDLLRSKALFPSFVRAKTLAKVD
jgi:hypothetical protein